MSKQYVIQWQFKPMSYLKQMTAIGPAFGATLKDAMRFDSKDEAVRMHNSFPTVAFCGSEIIPVESKP